MEAAIKNIGYRLPRCRIVANLARADIRKEGASSDLPIATAIAASTGMISHEKIDKYMLVGELSLDGTIRPVKGVLPIAIQARKMKFDGLIVPEANAREAAIVNQLNGAGGKILRELGLEAEMYRRRHPTKQGVKVYGQSERGTWFVPVTGRDDDWKLFDWDTWQVRRSDFDKMMLDEAVARGACLVPGRATQPLLTDTGAVRGVQVQLAADDVMTIESDVLLDCSCQATWLANLGQVTGPKYLGAYDKQIAIFSQVSGALRDHGQTRDTHQDNTLIFYQKKYDWAWFIPLDDDVVSVGVVIPAAYFLDKKESKRDFLAFAALPPTPRMNSRPPRSRSARNSRARRSSAAASICRQIEAASAR